MNGEYTFNALQFEDYDIRDDQIKAITTIEGYAFVDNGYGNLSLKPQSAQMQLMAKTLFVH